MYKAYIKKAIFLIYYLFIPRMVLLILLRKIALDRKGRYDIVPLDVFENYY